MWFNGIAMVTIRLETVYRNTRITHGENRRNFFLYINDDNMYIYNFSLWLLHIHLSLLIEYIYIYSIRIYYLFMSFVEHVSLLRMGSSSISLFFFFYLWYFPWMFLARISYIFRRKGEILHFIFLLLSFVNFVF